MDRLRKMQMLMQNMAVKEGNVPDDHISKTTDFFSRIEKSLNELEELKSKYAEEPGAEDEEKEEKPVPEIEEKKKELESFKNDAEKEILKYEELIKKIEKQREESKNLPEAVRKVSDAMTKDLKSGFENYLSSYEEIKLAIEDEDSSLCAGAKDMAEKGEKIISEIETTIAKAKDDIPMDA